MSDHHDASIPVAVSMLFARGQLRNSRHLSQAARSCASVCRMLPRIRAGLGTERLLFFLAVTAKSTAEEVIDRSRRSIASSFKW